MKLKIIFLPVMYQIIESKNMTEVYFPSEWIQSVSKN